MTENKCRNVCTAGFRRSRFSPAGRPHQKEADRLLAVVHFGRKMSTNCHSYNLIRFSRGAADTPAQKLTASGQLFESESRDSLRNSRFFLRLQRCQSEKKNLTVYRLFQNGVKRWSLPLSLKASSSPDLNTKMTEPIVRAPRTLHSMAGHQKQKCARRLAKNANCVLCTNEIKENFEMFHQDTDCFTHRFEIF
jgi:hypothetical protein